MMGNINGDRKGKARAFVQDEDEKENIRDQAEDYHRLPRIKHSTSQDSSFLDLNNDLTSHASSTFFPKRMSSKLAAPSREFGTRYEPVRFSSISSNPQNLDEHGLHDNPQLIDAFRNSYATHLTADRDSSYSWAMSGRESQGTTLDFAGAAAAGDNNSSSGDYLSVDSLRPTLGDRETFGNNFKRMQAGQSEGYFEWDPDSKEAQRAQARKSSWDHQIANEINGRGAPSIVQTAKQDKGVLKTERESAISAFDPFQYAVRPCSINQSDCMLYG